MMQTIENWQHCQFAFRCSRRDRWGNRKALSQALMWAGVVEAVTVFLDAAEELSFTQDKYTVQTLATQTAEEPFTYSISARCCDGRPKNSNPRACRDPVELRPIFAVMVANEIPRACAKRRRLSQLLRYPDLAGMACNRGMDHPPGRDFNDDEDKNVSKPENVDL